MFQVRFQTSGFQKILVCSILLVPALGFRAHARLPRPSTAGACVGKATRSTDSAAGPTVYYTARVRLDSGRCSGAQKVTVPGIRGLMICPQDLRTCRLEGSCLVEDSTGRRLGINYASKGRFTTVNLSRCPFGYGQTHPRTGKPICLVPYRTVAADRRLHKPGDVLYIPGLRNVILPDGTRHDGHVVVGDVGGAIRGARLDFFTGTDSDRSRNNPFLACGLGNRKSRVFYQKVSESTAAGIRAAQNFPDYPRESKPTRRAAPVLHAAR